MLCGALDEVSFMVNYNKCTRQIEEPKLSLSLTRGALSIKDDIWSNEIKYDK